MLSLQTAMIAVAALLTGAGVAAMILRRGADKAPAAPARGTGSRREELFRIAFEQAGVGVALVSLDGQWLQVNNRLLQLLGYRREELVRNALRDLVHPDDRKFADAQRKRLESGEIEFWTTEARLLQRGGVLVPLRINVALCRRGSDEPYYEYVFEPADRAGAVRAASPAAASKYDDVIDQLEDIGVFRVDAGSNITLWSRGAEKIFGYTASAAIGKPLSMLYRDPDIHEERHDHDVRDALKRGKVEYDASLVRKDGFVVSTLFTLLRSTDGSVICVVRQPAHMRRNETERDAIGQKALFDARASSERIEREAKAKINELTKRATDAERELLRQKGVEKSIREAFRELTARSEETFRELKIMTDALKSEIARRKEADALIDELREELAAVRPEWHLDLSEPQPGTSEETETPVDLSWSPTSLEGFRETLLAFEEEGFTGTVKARRGVDEVSTYIELGHVIACVSNQPGQRLGELLVERGLVSAEQRDRALEVQMQSGIALGRILVITDAVDEKQLMTLMRRRTESEGRLMFGWDEFEASIVPGEFALHRFVPVHVPLSEFVAAASRPPEPEEVVARPATDTPAPSAVIEPPEPPMSGEEPAPASGAASTDTTEASEGTTPADLPIPLPDTVPAETEPDVIAAPPAVPVAEELTIGTAVEGADPVVGTGSKKTRKYHRANCSALVRTAKKSRVDFASEAEAADAGYQPCGICFRKRAQKSA